MNTLLEVQSRGLNWFELGWGLVGCGGVGVGWGRLEWCGGVG